MKKPVCKICGSDDITCEASAKWDTVTQRWVVAAAFPEYTCWGCDRSELEEDRIIWEDYEY
jgi:hypothetical protein